MAIAANNRVTVAKSAADPQTHSYTVGSGSNRLLLVKFTDESADTNTPFVNEVRWGGSGGTLLTQAVLATSASATRRIAAIYYLVNPTAATQDVWIDLTTSRAVGLEIVWFSGVDQSTPIADVDSSTTGTTAISTPELTPSGADNWLETVMCSGNQALAYAPTGSATESGDLDATATRACFSWQSGISAGVTPGWAADGHATGSDLELAAVLLKPSAGAVYTQTAFRLYNDDGTGLGQPSFSEDWTGANGAVWNAARWTTAKEGATAIIDIQSNQGRMQGSGTHTWVRALAISPVYDVFDLTIQFTFGTTTDNQFHWLTFRHGGTWATSEPYRPQNGYQVAMWRDTTNHFGLESVVSGTSSGLASPNNKAWGTGIWNMRVRAVGTALKVRAWQGTEPGTWDIEVTNGDHTSGVIGLSSDTSAGSTPIHWDNLNAIGI